MAIELDGEGKIQLQKVLGKRLRASRRAARMTEMDAARILNHKEATQLSLWESGDRLPPLAALIKLAKAYSVSLDYLVGLHDDPIADPMESNQGVIVNALSSSMSGCFEKFTLAVAEHAAITLSGFGADRRQLREMCVSAAEVDSALKRVKELNPEFEEDMKGSARLDTLINGMVQKGRDFERRLSSERLSLEVIDKEIRVADMHESVEQLMMSFTA